MISGLVLTPGFAPLASPAVTVSTAHNRPNHQHLVPLLLPHVDAAGVGPTQAPRADERLLPSRAPGAALEPACAACDALPAWLNALQQAAQAYLFLRRVLPDVSSSEAFSSIASSPSGPCAPDLGLTPAESRVL